MTWRSERMFLGLRIFSLEDKQFYLLIVWWILSFNILVYEMVKLETLELFFDSDDSRKSFPVKSVEEARKTRQPYSLLNNTFNQIM